MATPGQKLAESLDVLRELQAENKASAVKTAEISRTHRERLIKNGFLKEVAKGWYIIVDPDEKVGDSTSWYTSFWQFCSRYLNEKYGNQYCISAEQSLLIHIGNFTVPDQLIVRAPNAPNKVIPLVHETSIFELKSELPNNADISVINGIRVLIFPLAIIKCTPVMFEKNPTDMRAALSQIKDSSEILRPLLEGSHTVIAGRLAGAFRNIGQSYIADEIVKTMRSADFKITETDPFKNKPQTVLSFIGKSPYVNRIKLMWYEFREVVINNFPSDPGLPKDHESYLKSIDHIYITDAYHSLSIERYKVSRNLIEKVRKGNWDTLQNEEDRSHKDAMAARGYWLSSQVVKNSIQKILSGSNPGQIAASDHGDWYRELFTPSVTAGILSLSELAGYRTHQVYISNSRHVPLNTEAVRDIMPVFFELLSSEENPAVRAVLGHFIFVYIHPYMDGNGRIARFLMNTMLASGGYPWTVIPVEKRNIYMNSLEKASVDGNIKPFTLFVSNLVSESMKGTPLANIDSIK